MATSTRICKHMNEDHADSLLAFAWYFARQPTASSATLENIDLKGKTIFRCPSDLSTELR